MKTLPVSYTLITGGAGFIGTNLASRLADQGEQVLVYDNLSRQGVERNLEWLLQRYPEQITFWNADVRDAERINEAVTKGANAVFHLAAQVAVTTSLEDPVYDFEVNARGTLNVLEALRKMSSPPPLLYTSTNKVFGGFDSLKVLERETRYEPEDEIVLANGIGEEWRTEFCSPYGCSKGAADQYVLDYSRCYHLPAVVFRMSCIYGPHQYGNEDQGWVAHFVRQSLESQPITFYGDGKQVRDALFVDDLVEAALLAVKNIEMVRGQAFNIGGGVANTTSLIELVDRIAELQGQTPEIRKEAWRPSDQRYYVSNLNAFNSVTAWKPRVGLPEGLSRLHNWAIENRVRENRVLDHLGTDDQVVQ
ncbi:MAG: SDR family NAD(P)-dependent oxidoreductase [Bdellovibrionales bacterium]